MRTLVLYSLKENLGQLNLPDEVIRSALAGLESPLLVTATPEIKELAIKVLAKTISRVFAMIFCGGGSGFRELSWTEMGN